MMWRSRAEIAELYKKNADVISGKVPYRNIFTRGFKWMGEFSPIELAMWEFMQYQRLPFYPEFPQLNYFLDFADPVRKIIIECDGKEFHKDDNREKDYDRDHNLGKLGWTVFRIKGSEFFIEIEDKESARWLHMTVDGFMHALTNMLYSTESVYGDPDRYGDLYNALIGRRGHHQSNIQETHFRCLDINRDFEANRIYKYIDIYSGKNGKVIYRMDVSELPKTVINESVERMIEGFEKPYLVPLEVESRVRMEDGKLE